MPPRGPGAFPSPGGRQSAKKQLDPWQIWGRGRMPVINQPGPGCPGPPAPRFADIQPRRMPWPRLRAPRFAVVGWILAVSSGGTRWQSQPIGNRGESAGRESSAPPKPSLPRTVFSHGQCPLLFPAIWGGRAWLENPASADERPGHFNPEDPLASNSCLIHPTAGYAPQRPLAFPLEEGGGMKW